MLHTLESAARRYKKSPITVTLSGFIIGPSCFVSAVTFPSSIIIAISIYC